MSGAAGDEVGFGKPPKATRFQKGRSGNPRGRPRRRTRAIPYDHVLGQMVTIRENGCDKRVTAAEAFLLQLMKKGLEGCGASARASLASIEQARAAARADRAGATPIQFTIRTFGLCCIIEDFGMAVRLNGKNEETVCLKLKPWMVEAATARMTPGKLTREEQAVVVASTKAPEKVRWPDWWAVKS